MEYRIRNYKKAERYGVTVAPGTGMLSFDLSKMPKECGTIDRFVRMLEKEEVIEYEC